LHPSSGESGSLGSLLCVHLHFELVCLTWTGLRHRSDLGRSDETEKDGSKGAALSGAAAAAAAPLEDAALLREIESADAELALGAERLDPSVLEALNESMAARASYLGRVRDLLEVQLEGMQAVGAYSIIGCSARRGSNDSPFPQLCPACQCSARRPVSRSPQVLAGCD
jgi:hypothetical protein